MLNIFHVGYLCENCLFGFFILTLKLGYLFLLLFRSLFILDDNLVSDVLFANSFILLYESALCFLDWSFYCIRYLICCASICLLLLPEFRESYPKILPRLTNIIELFYCVVF